MSTRFFTKPAICITLPRAETFAEHSTLVIKTGPGCTKTEEERFIESVERLYPQIQCYVEHRDNQPYVKMSKIARKLIGGISDAEFLSTIGIAA